MRSTIIVNAAFCARCLTHRVNTPNGNYFMAIACVRFLCAKSDVAEDERVSTENE